jgi:hypothetical protein
MLKKDLLRLAALLASGALAAACLSVLVSGRVEAIPLSLATELSLYMTFYALIATIAKLGIDNLLFTRASDTDALASMRLTRFVSLWVLPIALVGATVSATRFGWLLLVPTALALVIDTRSTLLGAVLSGRGDTTPTSIGTLLNLPLFFVLLITATFFVDASMGLAAVLLATSSLARYSFLSSKGTLPNGSAELGIGILLGFGAQQTLNYVMFRADQIALGVATYTGLSDVVPPAEQLAPYLLNAKAYEIVCSITALACVVAFPKQIAVAEVAGTKKDAESGRAAVRVSPGSTARVRLLMVGLVVLCCGMLVYGWLHRFDARHLPFAAAGGLSLVVNIQTYAALRAGRINTLIFAQLIALLFGAVWLVFVARSSGLTGLAYMVPMQMLLFLMLASRR